MSAWLSAYRAVGRAGVALRVPDLALRGRPEERRERLGYVPAGDPETPPLWLHAASLGETVAAGALLEELRKAGIAPVALSTMTRTALERAREYRPDVGPFFAPLDVEGPVSTALDRLRPRALVTLEGEFWPIWLAALGRRQKPWAAASARMSDRSFRRYRRFGGPMAALWANAGAIAARSDDDAARFVELGVPESVVAVTGDLKEAQPLAPVVERGEEPWRVLAACTRPGEEDEVILAIHGISAQIPRGELWIAPRHPKRFAEVAETLRQALFPVRRYADRAAGPETGWSIVLVDEMGVLGPCYDACDVAIVGGSLRPFRGHSPLEAARAARPVIMGPHVENCRDVVRRLEDAGALLTTRSAAELAAALLHFGLDREAGRRAGRQGRRVMEDAQHVGERTLEHLAGRGIV